MEYVRTHGRITRRETKALCEIKSAQATRLLRRLVDKGELKMLGQKRGTSYMSARPNSRTKSKDRCGLSLVTAGI